MCCALTSHLFWIAVSGLNEVLHIIISKAMHNLSVNVYEYKLLLFIRDLLLQIPLLSFTPAHLFFSTCV